MLVSRRHDFAATAIAMALLFAVPVRGADQSFAVSLQLLTPIQLTSAQALSFGAVTAGSAKAVVIAPATGAKFSSIGEANGAVTGSIIENGILLNAGGGSSSAQQIVVDGFVVGGDMDATGNAVFDTSGQLNDLRIGATAHIESEDIVGVYAGSATFRLLYQ